MSTELFCEIGFAFLDPKNCGSTLRWKVDVDEYGNKPTDKFCSVGGEVSLTDCHRCITWQLGDADHYDDKLRKAIEELQRCRKALRTARAERAKWYKAYGKPKPEDN